MKIAHIVTYISQDGAFGGPVAVAIAQAVELARRGHDIELLAGWDGYAQVRAPGVKVRLFRVRRLPVGGFSGLFSSEMLRYLEQHIGEYDAVHVHLARDLITLRAANLLRRTGTRYVLQPHGMIIRDKRIRARIFDTLATRRVLSAASTIFVLSTREREEIVSVRRDANVCLLRNGIDELVEPQPENISKPTPEVLFLARLHPRKRVMAFAKMAETLVTRGARARFVVVGPDEGDLSELLAFISERSARSYLHYEGSLPQGDARRRLARSAVYVLPAFAEVFPMTVLEALSAGTPVVITRDCDIAQELESSTAALVTDGSPESLADAVASILEDAALRQHLISSGGKLVRERYSIDAVASRLEDAYRE